MRRFQGFPLLSAGWTSSRRAGFTLEPGPSPDQDDGNQFKPHFWGAVFDVLSCHFLPCLRPLGVHRLRPPLIGGELFFTWTPLLSPPPAYSSETGSLILMRAAAGAVGASGCRALWEISTTTNCDLLPLECANQNQER